MDFVWIPPGDFMMGSPPGEDGRFENERQHRVHLTNGFWLSRTPVTQAQYERVVGENPSYFRGATNPVDSVSWDDAVEFADRLGTIVEGHFRLPTEAEWEYACRAGTTTAFHFGDDPAPLRDHAWYRANSENQTHPVGLKLPNAWGLYDMHGNVWEWCSDLYGEYPAGPVTDPTGAQTGEERVLRGGSWGLPYAFCRSATRRQSIADNPGDENGVRVVLEAR